MCGILGYYSKINISRSSFEDYLNLIKHRGPDDFGVEQFNFPNFQVGFGHRRLSILDLSSNGHQPMFSSDKKVMIIFNGEIYNFLNLKEIFFHDTNFNSNSDTEVILHMYQKFGSSMFNYFDGMFAIAIYDFEKNSIILGRDKFGEKPLYYYLDSNQFVFSSELKTILSFPNIDKNLDYDSLKKFMFYGYINSPNSIFKYVNKLIPGQYIIFNNFSIEKYTYWNSIISFNKLRNSFKGSISQAVSKLDNLLNESVKSRLISDVPVGVFLSGGLDSSLISYYAQKNSKTKLHSFNIGFTEKAFDESEKAKIAAEFIGTNHHSLIIDANYMEKFVKSMVDYYDEPMADSSLIPTMIVSSEAKKFVSVVLTGDAGDEIFSGYTRYDYIYKAQQFDKVGGLLNFIDKHLFHGKLKKSLPLGIRIVMDNRDKNFKAQAISSDQKNSFFKMFLNSDSIELKYDFERHINTKSFVEKLMLIDMNSVLPEDLLQKVDKATMRYALEARAPFLSQNLTDFAFSLPLNFKFSLSFKKIVLRKLAKMKLPQNLLNFPKKGFSIPLYEWMKTKFISDIKFYSSKEFILKQSIFNYSYIENLITRFIDSKSKLEFKDTNLIWNFLVFQLWYEKYIIPKS